ncbi:uncharacterized protein LOC128962092 isoform X2 [Oppia nitens]|uniref:uncharacterized protein LOC128962092 isoform X2 n=1 Tax=Oppia nitens TaxID=1686743 RepID=UPI0023DAFD56|nr:uncharacterized protein LOC128962092 isoform X2 [Oppia nitens]
MKSIYMIALLVSTIIFVVIIESKDFCEEYRKNDNKIDVSMSLYKEYGYPEDMILLFIGNTYWKVSVNANNTVMIDTQSAGQSNLLSADKNSMIWSFKFDVTDNVYDEQQIDDNELPFCRMGSLEKDKQTIDWKEQTSL